MEDAFRKVSGVIDVTSGYQGGRTAKPTYGDVCSGLTGHTETVEVKYDPAIVSYRQLLDVFWSVHNPTHDLIDYHDGQYKSVIFYVDEQQMQEASSSIADFKEIRHITAVATQLLPYATFWRAEEYHQRYYEKHRNFACRS